MRSCKMARKKLIKGENDLYTMCIKFNKPYLLDEWNEDVLMSNVVYNESKEYEWKCSENHIYKMRLDIRWRSKISACPYCNNKKILKGFNDLESQCPDIARDWDYAVNNCLPSDIYYASHSIVGWVCHNCNHRWTASVRYRSQKMSKCPNCKCENLAKITIRALDDILPEFDYLKNEFDIQVISKSDRQVWWKCPNGHSYQNSIYCRLKQNQNCPYCANQKVLTGFNDLETLFPDIAKEWHPTKNGDLHPSDVLSKINKKVFWLGECGHVFEQTIAQRTLRKDGCPYCSGKLVLKGFNDLKSQRPDLMPYWDYDANNSNNIYPDDVTIYSNIKVNWICELGHKYQSSIYDKSRIDGKDIGCPHCSKESKTSFPEQAVYYYLHLYINDAESDNRTMLDGFELDVYIPSLSVGIEYDGSTWHSKNKDEAKNELCRSKGIKLIRIRENDSAELTNASNDVIVYTYNYPNYAQLSNIIINILEKLNGPYNYDVDIIRDKQLIYSNYIVSRKNNSLAALHPLLVSEWHPTKNEGLSPENISHKSDKKVWWQCKNGHEWEATPHSRINNSSGCPYCANKKVWKGFNDLESQKPSVLSLWDYDMNVVTPNDVVVSSAKKVYWKCNICGHCWQTSVRCVAIQGTRCMKCSHKQKHG